MVLIGLPGSGKSTFVRYIALRHAQALKDSTMDLRAALEGWEGAALIPVIVPLGQMAEGLPEGPQRGRAEHVEEYILQMLKADERAAPYAEHLFADLEQRGGLFLFDGLDEVADLNRRPQVVQAVEDFAQRFDDNPRSRFLVACRTFSYTDPHWQLAGWTTHELAPLDSKKIEQFIVAWHTELIRVDPARRNDYEAKQKKLRQALRPGDRRRLAEIADNPLILTVMAVVHTNRDELPDARALVYEQCIDLLLLRWDAERPIVGSKPQKRNILDELGVPEIQLKNALQEIAYQAHAGQMERPMQAKAEAALVTEGLLTGVLFPFFHDPKKVQIFLDYCEGANGLLLKQGVVPLRGAPPDAPAQAIYTFPHLTFQEYLAARYLRRKPNLSLEVRQHLDRSDLWREAIMLLGEHLCFREGDKVLMDTILEALAPEPQPEEMRPQDWRALWMAGDLLILYHRALGRYAHESRVLEGLVQLLQRSRLPARERAAAGDVLAALGDPRFDAKLWYLPDEPLLGFARVPAGRFKMGSDKDEDAEDNERLQHEVNLPEYYLSRYPVTVAQFRAFIEARGRPPEDPYSLEGPDNRPVRWVTWNEAVEYCRWLNEELRRLAGEKLQGELAAEQGEFWRRLEAGELEIGLPSEAEWEKTARGADGRIYPWGGDFDPEKANTVETGLGSASAVGCFPDGKSPYGLQDMSGNVWEWTRSLSGDYPYPDDVVRRQEREALEAEGPRVFRGGSFIFSRWNARCAFRYRLDPDGRNRLIGFRVGALLKPLGSGSSGALGL